MKTRRDLPGNRGKPLQEGEISLRASIPIRAGKASPATIKADGGGAAAAEEGAARTKAAAILRVSAKVVLNRDTAKTEAGLGPPRRLRDRSAPKSSSCSRRRRQWILLSGFNLKRARLIPRCARWTFLPR